MLKSSTEHKLLNALPNDKPITAIQIVENLENCPSGFHAISRTYDQDSDADLRENTIFKVSPPRYLCFSKAERLPNFVIQEIIVLTDKFKPPRGFSLVSRTTDSEQRAWKKKQLCYRLADAKQARIAITDIIVCSRLKKAPEDFQSAGELNGICVCYKMGNVQEAQGTPTNKPLQVTQGGSLYPNIGGDINDHDYEILKPPAPGYPLGPTRPAPPRPPAPVPHQNSTNTLGLGGGTSLDGVPFIVNPKFLNPATADRFQFPVVRAKTMQQIMREYDYPFTVERQT